MIRPISDCTCNQPSITSVVKLLVLDLENNRIIPSLKHLNGNNKFNMTLKVLERRKTIDFLRKSSD